LGAPDVWVDTPQFVVRTKKSVEPDKFDEVLVFPVVERSRRDSEVSSAAVSSGDDDDFQDVQEQA